MSTNNKSGELILSILIKPELSEHNLKVDYGELPSSVRDKLAKRLGIAPQRIKLYVKRVDGSEIDVTYRSESVGSLIEKYGNVWYASIEEPYGSFFRDYDPLEDAVETFRSHYFSSSKLTKQFVPIDGKDPGKGIYAYRKCKKKDYCAQNSTYTVFVLPSIGYPKTEPLIYVTPKIWHKCCFYNLTSDYFLTKAKEIPLLSTSLERIAQMLNVNACIMHVESWDYISQQENPLEVMTDALCTDVGLCDGNAP
ncbi:hypothetical protein EYM_06865 [Ignicoccus islandicus DSM 13165]|uniref:Ubiquitin-like domain-containing protein n=1 Tax=Ignicoccus islandicus DSM 13165 TaxID=940295 RepID=A0A0U3E480_9CREN|nr:hypothetical protein [Ignicoccus islandicus]ALU12731.1 hypothetical protein EYM_06865 [Ignicoccus islandicus DSM 13165]